MTLRTGYASRQFLIDAFVQCPTLGTGRLVSGVRFCVGLAGSFFVTDESSGEALSVGVWESLEQARAFENSGPYATLKKLFDDLKTGAASRTIYEFADVDRLDIGGEADSRTSGEAHAPMH